MPPSFCYMSWMYGSHAAKPVPPEAPDPYLRINDNEER
jgi:hypothetical protein